MLLDTRAPSETAETAKAATSPAARLRVSVWDADRFGKMAIRAIIDDPRLDLAGIFADSDAEKGLDAGELSGRPDCGILASDDIDAVLAQNADIVIYTAPKSNLAHVVKLLETGHDVISTNPFHDLGGLEGELVEALEAACARGGSSLHISGLFPGWVDSVAAATTGLCKSVETLSITESAYAAHYESVETWTSVGMGQSGTTPEVVEAARHFLAPFHDTILRLADMLGFALDSVDFAIEHATAIDKVDLGWFCMERGTNVAMRAGWNGTIGGKTVIRTGMIWYLAREVNEGWSFSDDNYHIVIEGQPGIDTRIRIDSPTEWTNTERALPTMMPAINSIFHVKAARPGILSISDAVPFALSVN